MYCVQLNNCSCEFIYIPQKFKDIIGLKLTL